MQAGHNANAVLDAATGQGGQLLSGDGHGHKKVGANLAATTSGQQLKHEKDSVLNPLPGHSGHHIVLAAHLFGQLNVQGTQQGGGWSLAPDQTFELSRLRGQASGGERGGA